MVPNHNNRHRHAMLPMLAPIHNLVSITIHNNYRKTSVHNGMVPNPTHNRRPISNRIHLTKPNDHLFYMDGIRDQHLDAIHTHIEGTTSMSHTGKDYHRKTGNLLKRLFVPSLVAME